MKLNFYIILLLLLSFVVKADQILELIKIPNLTLHKPITIFLVTKVSPLTGLSWLKRIPLHA